MEEVNGSVIRSLSRGEKNALISMSAGMSDEDRAQFLQDLELAKVTPATVDESRLTFVLPGVERTTYSGQHAYPVEGCVKDADGAELVVLLHRDHLDRLLELELVRYEEGPVAGPDWSTFRVRY